jgi:DNA-binding MarR family transcriptional regulator
VRKAFGKGALADVLVGLHAHPWSSVREISRRANRAIPDVADALDRLQATGLVTRRNGLFDLRERSVWDALFSTKRPR